MNDPKQVEIKSLALFRECRAADVRWIASVADTVDVPAGRTITREGQTAREFIVVVRGVAAGGDLLLTPGAYFGETGLINGRPHDRTVETLTPTRMLVFEARAFRSLLDRVPAVGRRLLSQMVHQLRTADQPSRSLRAVS